MKSLFCILVIAAAAWAADTERGRTLIESRDFKTAETEMQQIVNAEAENAAALRYLGIAQTHLGKGGAAVESLKKAVSLDGGNADARYALALAQVEAKQFGDAEATLREAEGIDGAHAQRSAVRGALLAAQRRFQDAVEPLEAAVSSRPDDAISHYYLGLAYSNMRRPDKMIKHFEEFLRLEPDSPNATRVRSFLKNVR